MPFSLSSLSSSSVRFRALKVYEVYSPSFKDITPLVSSSNSLRAHRRGLFTSLFLQPPATKIQSLNLRSRTVRNLG